ncbi:MAG: DUF2628 domain-containing protein [Oscillospiraceae bacterium]|nr:DUF2628 domain-containing protein [Oscillospiraceae bacterium]
MRYNHEICSVCDAEFDEHSDVVVCPSCGTPVHRQCWQTAGACPNVQSHGDEFAWKATQVAPPEPAAEQPKNLCDDCGEYTEPGMPFCPGCGAEQGQSSPMEMFSQMSVEREKAFVRDFPAHWVNGKQLRAGDVVVGQPVEEICLQLRSNQRTNERYLSRFARQRNLGWNWAAFAFGPYWMFFRKLFKPALIFGALALIGIFVMAPINEAMFGIVETYGANPPQAWAMIWGVVRAYQWQAIIAGGLWLGARLAAALLGDRLLQGKLVGNIEKVKREDAVLGFGEAAPHFSAGEGAMRRLNRHQVLARMGGVSFFAPLLYFWTLRILPSMLVSFVGMFVR